MPTKKDILREMTHKEDGLEIEQRIFYTLTDDKKSQSIMTAKAISVLVKLLQDKGIMSDEEIDEFLFEIVT